MAANRGVASRVLWYGLIAALVVALVGVALTKRDSKPAGAHAASGTKKKTTTTKPTQKSSSGVTSTTTQYQLTERVYSRGDCVTFDESPGGPDTRDTQVVPCDRPHLMEMTTSIALPVNLEAYPSEAQWKVTIAHDCAPSIRSLLGAPIDPVGRFYATGIRPTTQSWIDGDRTVWCGIGELPLAAPAHPDQDSPFTGKVERTPQARILPVGTCWVNESSFVVPCTKAHELEITAYVDLPGNVAAPPAPGDTAAWNRLVGEGCRTAARSYLGHDPVDDEAAGWLPIQPGSWAAGRRTVECSVSHYRGNDAIPSTGSLKA